MVKKCESISEEDFEQIWNKLKSHTKSIGLEFHPFCIKWYNEQVDKKFSLNYPDNILAFCVLSTPSYFDEQFLPFVRKQAFNKLTDPLDQCLTLGLNEVKESFEHTYQIDLIHDFEILPNRRPKLLVQTAGHVSGAAYYYQQTDIIEPLSLKDCKKLYGVSSHPLYGGWFSFRGAFIFKDAEVAFLKKREAIDKLNNEEKVQLLKSFNFHWEDSQYRDVGKPLERYSDLQKRYFLTKPPDRFKLIEEICKSSYKS